MVHDQAEAPTLAVRIILSSSSICLAFLTTGGKLSCHLCLLCLALLLLCRVILRHLEHLVLTYGLSGNAIMAANSEETVQKTIGHSCFMPTHGTGNTHAVPDQCGSADRLKRGTPGQYTGGKLKRSAPRDR